MDFHKSGVLFVALLFLLSIVTSQGQNSNGLQQTVNSLNQFALDFLTEITAEAGGNLNVAVSPFAIWSLLSILSEGADGDTLRELNQALRLPANKDAFRNAYRYLRNNLTEQRTGISLDINNAVFTPNDQQIKNTFRDVSQNVYGVDVLPLEIGDTARAVRTINNYVTRATRNRITNLVKKDDLENADIFLTSVIFFKGQWSTPFNKSATFTDTFIDEYNKPGPVRMMYINAPFPYSFIPQLQATVVELPYGAGDKMSMIAVLPSKNRLLADVISALRDYTMSRVIDDLNESVENYPDSEVHVYLPKFRVESDLNLNAALDKLGIRDLFNSQQANLLNLSFNYLFVSRILQKAYIDVDEEGTVAAAASGATLEDRTVPPKFYANRPFAFFIVERNTRSILFAGKISTPNGL